MKSILFATNDQSNARAMGHLLDDLTEDYSVQTSLEGSLSVLAEREFSLVAVQANLGHRREEIYTGSLKIFYHIKPLVLAERTKMALFASADYHLINVSLLIDPGNSGIFDYLPSHKMVDYIIDFMR